MPENQLSDPAKSTDYASELRKWASVMITDEQRGFLNGAATEIERLRAALAESNSKRGLVFIETDGTIRAPTWMDT